MNALPLFSLFAFIVMLVLLPILFGELLATSLAKLHLSPEMALLLMMAIIIGGLVNIPVRRIAHERVVPMHPLAVFGLGGLWPEMARERPETIIAINFGGCVVPAGLALCQLFHLATAGSSTLFALFVAATIYVAACYFSAQPVQGVGIVLLGLLPAAVAALMALLFARGRRRLSPISRCRRTGHRRRLAAPQGDRTERCRHGQHRWCGNLRRYCPVRHRGRLFGVMFLGNKSIHRPLTPETGVCPAMPSSACYAWARSW